MTTDEALKAYGRLVDGLEASLAAKDAEIAALRGLLSEVQRWLMNVTPRSLHARIARAALEMSGGVK